MRGVTASPAEGMWFLFIIGGQETAKMYVMGASSESRERGSALCWRLVRGDLPRGLGDCPEIADKADKEAGVDTSSRKVIEDAPRTQ